LLLIDDIGIREILQRVDKKVLSLALKGTTVDINGTGGVTVKGAIINIG